MKEKIIAGILAIGMLATITFLSKYAIASFKEPMFDDSYRGK